jgi:hypothetical protein
MKKSLVTPILSPRSLFSVSKAEICVADNLVDWAEMHHSDAIGIDVLYDSSGQKPFGLGWIKFPPYGEVKLHTHEGSHILICFAGSGVVKVVVEDLQRNSRIHTNQIGVGECYGIESLVPHSVHAGELGLLLLVVGNDYRQAAHQDRLQMVNG